MNTRLQFIQSIVRDKSMVDEIVDFFDHEMLLYELIGNTNSKVTIIESGPKNISFQIDGNKTNIKYLSNQLLSIQNQKVIEYEKPLGLEYSMISDKSINLTIKNS